MKYLVEFQELITYEEVVEGFDKDDASQRFIEDLNDGQLFKLADDMGEDSAFQLGNLYMVLNKYAGSTIYIDASSDHMVILDLENAEVHVARCRGSVIMFEGTLSIKEA